MKLSSSIMVLAAIVTGHATSSFVDQDFSMGHNATSHADPMRAYNEQRDIADRGSGLLLSDDLDHILSLGVRGPGANPTSKGATPWIGCDGAYTNQFINQSPEDLVLAVWGPAGSWVNTVVPQITISVPRGTAQIVSFPEGASGAWAPIYPDTALVNGQISETWGEYTFSEQGVVDVSREVNMLGKNMKIVGPTCTTDMDTCVFVCPDGETVCTYNYQLKNCTNGSQPGATYGLYAGSPSGGCGGMGTSAHLDTYLGYIM